MSSNLKIIELKKLAKSELIAEILLLEEEINALQTTKNRYKKRLKDGGIWERLESTNSLNVKIPSKGAVNKYGGIVKTPFKGGGVSEKGAVNQFGGIVKTPS